MIFFSWILFNYYAVKFLENHNLRLYNKENANFFKKNVTVLNTAEKPVVGTYLSKGPNRPPPPQVYTGPI